jgi:hypothetical protein
MYDISPWAHHIISTTLPDGPMVSNVQYYTMGPCRNDIYDTSASADNIKLTILLAGLILSNVQYYTMGPCRNQIYHITYWAHHMKLVILLAGPVKKYNIPYYLLLISPLWHRPMQSLNV